MSAPHANDRGRAAGRAAPWVTAASTLVAIAQLRGLVRGADGELDWNASLVLLLLALALANAAAWRQAWALGQLARRRSVLWEDES